ncbi:hypothetical protein ZIOFF_026783 [Zingiber officinale]|uniref:Uncharacterized protein n=1 Tax=Zingiber officinale TaxID=94328 RepID=A0A8J5HEV7_ZINOF|nr:hypothetical protein ZIOFF_026783 [Zingiber officinale]
MSLTTVGATATKVAIARPRGRRLFLGCRRLASSSRWGASLTTLGSIDTLSTLVPVHRSLSIVLEYIDADVLELVKNDTSSQSTFNCS